MLKKLNYLTKVIFLLITIIVPVSLFAASATIQYMSPSTTVSVGGEVYFIVNTAGFTGVLTYRVSDSFLGASDSNANIDSNGKFVWKPARQDVGTHTISINVTDQIGNTATVSQQITVPVIPTVTIQNLYPGSSVNAGQTIFFSAFAVGFTNPIYSASDSFVNSSLLAGSVNSGGGFSWTPKSYDVGNHTLTLTVTDSLGNSASATQNIIVGIATTTIGSIYPSSTVSFRQNVSFTVTAKGFTNPNFTITDSISGSSINSGNINNLGIFSWLPTPSDVGVHYLTIKVTDLLGNTSTISQQITVTNPQLQITGVSPGTTLNVGSPLSFTATSTGLTGPKYTITDSFSGSSISNMNIATTGVFMWTPKGADVGTHNIKILALDNSGSNATVNIMVTIKAQGTPITSPVISTVATNSNTDTINNLLALIAQLTSQIAELRKTQTVTSVSSFVFTKNLLVGATGTEVTELQKRLTTLGVYSGPIIGTFGPLTKAAVKKLQLKFGINPDGSVGVQTRKVLNGTM